ncbi:MAG: glutaredoxin family protein [Acidobacteriota bacterium]
MTTPPHGPPGWVRSGLSWASGPRRAVQCHCVRWLTATTGSQRYSVPVAHVIELFVREDCPGCPEARAALSRFSAIRSDVTILERNIDQAANVAASYHLFATPAIVIDGRAVLYGIPTLDQLATRCDAPAASE